MHSLIIYSIFAEVCNHHHYPIPGHSITPKRNSILINVFMLSCSVVFDSLDCSPPGSSVHVIFQTRILEWGCHFLLHGIFQTQGSNLCLLHLLHCKQIPYHWAIREASILISNHSQFLFPWALVATNLFYITCCHLQNALLSGITQYVTFWDCRFFT